uniref:NADH dehydrogenase subunit 2 n=1 Tax=Rhodymenia pseudopalmata TaxID=31502 RepID=V9NEW1_RHOPU|nr:NADH dehydrogenase subunit 2 [Rhodymenia pseudopalmata]AGO19272.1 NADH dehydrogenase subunit 2 [Rhodymenia pseudopalmata]
MTSIFYNIYPAVTEIYIIFSVCLLLLYGVLSSNFFSLGYPILSQNLGWLALQVSILSLILTYSQFPISMLYWNSLLISDTFVWNLKLIILFSVNLWLLLSLPYTKFEKLNSFEYWILSLLAVCAMLFVIQSFDILSIYLTIELQSLIFYILASFKRNSEFSTEAGLKYFVLGAFSSALLLFGSSILYGLTGLTNLNDFSKFFSGILIDENFYFIGILIGFAFVTVSFLFKISAAPFHMWAPDVYEGAPTSVTAFFSILPKVVILTLLFRFLVFSFYDFMPLWRNFIIICATFSLLIGSLGAFMQTKWKRFMAYSSITHIGFILIALLMGDSEGLISGIFYTFVYILTMLGSFSFIIGLRFYRYPTHYQTRYLWDIKALGKNNSLLANSMVIILFSMAGIPPLAGFFAKFFVLLIALQSHSIGISLIAIVASCISCFYYIRLIKTMYFIDLVDSIVTYPMSKETSFILGISILTLISIFIDLEFITNFITLMTLTF